MTKTKPKDFELANGRVYRYMKNVEHARDDDGRHWRKTSRGDAWQSVPHDAVNYHGRGNRQTAHCRSISHRAHNLIALQGKWASLRIPYLGKGATKSATGPVSDQINKKGDYANTMLGATGYRRATDYARANGGHANIPYEWCHLVSRGMHGANDPGNIVVATAHQNTEQCAIENALYKYRQEEFTVGVYALLVRGTEHLAENISYYIWHGNMLVYSTKMDGRRATAPSYIELKNITQQVCRACNKVLSRGTFGRYAQGWTLDVIDNAITDSWSYLRTFF